MSKYKHLTLDERFIIEKSLDKSLSFKAIGREIDRDCTTISKEIKSHILHKKSGAFGRHFNNCINRYNCSQSFLCDDIHCNRNHCNSCSKAFALCPDYIIEDCQKLKKPPYVCNGCTIRLKCTLEKALYHAAAAHKSYLTLLSESRTGIATSEEEIERLNSLISPLLQRGQSIHHLCSHNKDAIMLSEKTIYNYVDYNLFSARNIDLPRKVTYKPRKNNKSHLKIDKSCRINRSYQDFQHFLSLNPDTSIVEMDTVIGSKGGKVLLTIHFLNSLFMLAFLRDANTSSSVIDIFNDLYMTLSPQIFEVLFPVILTDNGSEFSNPSAIEFDLQDNRRT